MPNHGKGGRPSMYPRTVIGVCKICDRISARWVTSSSMARYNHYCGKTCKQLARTIGVRKAQAARRAGPLIGRKKVSDIKGPTEYEEALWK